MAARFKIVILEQQDTRTFRALFWADVPTARQAFYALPAGTVSAWKDAQAGDNAALVNGSVVEKVDTYQVPQGTTLAQAQAMLQATWQTYQDSITNTNRWGRYGSTWNGTTWVADGVA